MHENTDIILPVSHILSTYSFPRDAGDQSLYLCQRSDRSPEEEACCRNL